MKTEQILKELFIDSFFDATRADEIKELIISLTKDKNVVGHITLWINLEAKLYILTEFSLTEVFITKRNQSAVTVALNSLKKIDITRYAKGLYKFDRVIINLENKKFDFACNVFSDKVLEFLKALDLSSNKLFVNKLLKV